MNTWAAAGDRIFKAVWISRSSAALTILLLVMFPALLTAQTTLNPRSAEFTPSPDHSVNAPDGTPLVQSYQIEFYLSGASAPFQTASLGKPAPATDGMIRVDLTTIFLGWPVPGTVYTSTVAAVGPGGSGRSAQSNAFSFSAPCSYTVMPAAVSPAAAGGANNASVTTAAGCGWTATSNAPSWLTINSGASGSGNGTVAYTVAVNTSTSPRTGTLTVAGRTVTVTQAGASVPCTFTVAPTTLNPAAAASSSSSTVSTAASCNWTAMSNASWLTITSAASGSGNGTVTYNIAANTSTSPRTGTLTVAGRTVTVNQAGASGPCTFTVDPTTLNPAAAASSSSSTVSTAASCNWTAMSNASWLTITSAASGSGNGTVAYNIAANTSTSPRTGTLTVAGRTVTVTQQGACTFNVSPNSSTPPGSGATDTGTVTTTAGCGWTATSNVGWLTINSGATGSGSGTVGYTVAPNPGSTSRTGILTIAGQTLTVIQARASSTPSAPSNLRITP